MALITNGKDIQNAVYSVQKKDGYLVFLGLGGEEIARVKDEVGGDGLPYRLNLTDTGRINLKDSSGTVLSYVQQLSASEQASVREILNEPAQRLIHCGMFPFRWDGTKWVTGNVSYKKNMIDGGLSLDLTNGSHTSDTLPLVMTSSLGHLIVDTYYRCKLSCLECSNGGGGATGTNAYQKSSAGTVSYEFFVGISQNNTQITFNLQNITDTMRGWSAIGVLLEVYGNPIVDQ